jgi:hypothetical protein
MLSRNFGGISCGDLLGGERSNALDTGRGKRGELGNGSQRIVNPSGKTHDG